MIDGTLLSSTGSTLVLKDQNGFSRTVDTTSSTKYLKGTASVSRDSLSDGTHLLAIGSVDSDKTSLDASEVDVVTGPIGPAGPAGGLGAPAAPAPGAQASGKGATPAAPGNGAPKPPSGSSSGAPKPPSGAPSGAPKPPSGAPSGAPKPPAGGPSASPRSSASSSGS